MASCGPNLSGGEDGVGVEVEVFFQEQRAWCRVNVATIVERQFLGPSSVGVISVHCTLTQIRRFLYGH